MSSISPVRQSPPEPFKRVSPVSDFLDLKAQFAAIRDEVMEAVTRVLESQQFILGNEVKLFEQEVAAMLAAKHAVACASGSDALILALMGANIQPGDEVITTPFSFVATAGSIARVGAKPVFVDIDPRSFNIAPDQIEGAVSSKTRAVMPVHLFGLPADLGTIMHVANKHGLAVIEDAAQAIGARYRGRCVGTFGFAGCFSFFPSKNLGGAGDGGLLTTEDPAIAEQLLMLRVHGSRKKYHHEILGVNSRLDALQASILRVKLRHLDEWTSGRQARARMYRSLFEEAGLTRLVRLPDASTECVHVYNQFSIRCRQRDSLREFLRRAGIPTEIYYPLPLHLQPAFSYLGYRQGQFPEAEAASREILALPVYPEFKEEQQVSVVRAIAAFYRTKDATMAVHSSVE
jgi:dTDP-4-amino-4,6-dideoxygalactose transaminase